MLDRTMLAPLLLAGMCGSLLTTGPVLSPATAALANGDDVRAQFLVSMQHRGVDRASDP